MPTWMFHGRVLPQGDAIDLGARLEGVDWFRDGDRIRCDMEIFLSTGLAIVIVKCDARYDVVELRSAVMRHVQSVLDLRSFERRTAATLEIEDAIDMDTHERRTFGSYVPDEPTSPFTFEQLLKARNLSFALQNALANRRLAITHPWDTGLYCQRAIESLRQHFVAPGDGDNKKASWKRTQINLRLSENWLRFLGERSNEQRHGDHKTFFSYEERIELIARIRCAIDRFISFLLQGAESAIDAAQFPDL